MLSLKIKESCSKVVKCLYPRPSDTRQGCKGVISIQETCMRISNEVVLFMLHICFFLPIEDVIKTITKRELYFTCNIIILNFPFHSCPK